MFSRLVRFNNTDETPTTESGKPLSVAISLMLIIGNSCIMGHRGKGGEGGGGCTDEQTSHCFGPLSFIMLPFPSLSIACSMKGSFFRSISYNEGCMNEWKNERKERKKEVRKTKREF